MQVDIQKLRKLAGLPALNEAQAKGKYIAAFDNGMDAINAKLKECIAIMEGFDFTHWIDYQAQGSKEVGDNYDALLDALKKAQARAVILAKDPYGRAKKK